MGDDYRVYSGGDQEFGPSMILSHRFLVAPTPAIGTLRLLR